MSDLESVMNFDNPVYIVEWGEFYTDFYTPSQAMLHRPLITLDYNKARKMFDDTCDFIKNEVGEENFEIEINTDYANDKTKFYTRVSWTYPKEKFDDLPCDKVGCMRIIRDFIE